MQVISETLRVANLISGVFRRANTDIHFKGLLLQHKLSPSCCSLPQPVRLQRSLLFSSLLLICCLGHVIPKGCKIFASFRAVHLSLDHYENARTFDPWRWQQVHSSENTICYAVACSCSSFL